MRGKFPFLVAALAVITLSLTGCGKSSGTAPAVTTVNKGVIAASGNIAVNGVFYSMSGAGIIIDGLPGNRSDLQAGMVVTVRGVFDNRTSHAIRRAATSVEYASDFQGPVDCVNILNNSLTILGQQVLIGTAPPHQTVFANFTSTGAIFANFSTVSRLNPHLSPQLDAQLYNAVRVSGFSNGINGFLATRIELIAQNVDLATSIPIMIRGTLSNEDIPGQTFTIGNLTIDYSTMNPVYVPNPFVTTTFTNLSTVNPTLIPQTLANDLFVRVTGLSSEFEPGNAPTLTPAGPTSITLIKEGPSVKEGDHVAMAGFVTGLSGSSFKVGGIVVNASTISLSGITNSILVEVEGTVTKGILTATRITPL